MSTREITNNELIEVFQSIQLMADRYFRTMMGALNFREMTEDQQIEAFNSSILPLWEKAGCPEKGKAGYLDFQDSVRNSWE